MLVKLEEVDSYKSVLINEYHLHLTNKHGPANAPNKFADIFLFHSDIVVSFYFNTV